MSTDKHDTLVKHIFYVVFILIIGFIIGYFVAAETSGNHYNVEGQGASVYSVNTLTAPDYRWVCQGFQGCWCETDSGQMAGTTRQIDEKACTAAIAVSPTNPFLTNVTPTSSTVSPTTGTTAITIGSFIPSKSFGIGSTGSKPGQITDTSWLTWCNSQKGIISTNADGSWSCNAQAVGSVAANEWVSVASRGWKACPAGAVSYSDTAGLWCNVSGALGNASNSAAAKN
jgi:hypothetical protein